MASCVSEAASGIDVLSEDDDCARQMIINASNLWKAFDLSSRNSQLDQATTQSREHREQSQAARKHLGESTKRFKKVVKSTESSASSLANFLSSVEHNDPEKWKEVAASTVKSIENLGKEGRTTIKSYQEEIDNLTRRCKHSDSALLGLHAALAGLPDPVGILAATLKRLETMVVRTTENRDQIQTLEYENKHLKEEVEAAKREAQQAAAAASSSKNVSEELSESKALKKSEREELIQLRREVSEYEIEFRSLQNQDITIRKLEAKIADMQRSAEEDLTAKIAAAEESIVAEQSRRVADALEREALLERKVEGLELELRAAQAGLAATHNQIFEQGEGLGEREAAWEAQRAILMNDADRLREELYDATRERDGLRLRVAALENNTKDSSSIRSGTDVGGGDDDADLEEIPLGSGGPSEIDMDLERRAYEAEVRELTAANTAMRDELRSKEDIFEGERLNFRGALSNLERERNELLSKVADLEAMAAAAPSPEAIETMRRELRFLRRLEYNATGEDDDEFHDDKDHAKDPEMTSGRNSATGVDGSDDDRDLETVLVDRLRKSEAELLRERREKGELEEERESLRRKISKLEMERVELNELVAKLENDLERAISSPAMSSAGEPLALPHKALDDQSALHGILEQKDGRQLSALETSATSAVVATTEASTEVAPRSMAGASSATSSEKANDDHSVVTIIMAQRDRLRARCDALEAERDSFKRELQEQVRSADGLKADNTKLYEKVRYLQNYASKTSSKPGHGGVLPPPPPDSDLDLEALEERYEASVDPFRQFSRAERQRKLREMSPMERIVFVTAKTVLATKQLRTLLFFYVLGMHMLVFITTHHWSHGSTCHDVLSEHDALAHLHHGVPKLEDGTVAEVAGVVAAAAGNATFRK